MDVKFKILGSSSSGNAALLRIPGLNILIDAGLSGKKNRSFIEKRGLAPEALNAVFLTHEHNDHSAGVRGLSKFSNPTIFCESGYHPSNSAEATKAPEMESI